MSTPWIQTRQGRAVDLVAPSPDDISADDIAFALGRLCRYVGHTRWHYSVAEHSVHIARYLEPLHGPAVALGGLLHDGAEYVLGDIAAPVKRALGPAARQAIDQLFARVDAAICRALDVDLAMLHDPRVKEADLRILHDERHAMHTREPRSWELDHVEPLGIEVYGWHAHVATDKWMAEYDRLKKATS